MNLWDTEFDKLHVKETMSTKMCSLGAKHGDEEVVFYLRSITVAEESRYTNRYAEISDLDSEEKRSEQEYLILTDSIASWSEKVPIVKIAGKEVERPET